MVGYMPADAAKRTTVKRLKPQTPDSVAYPSWAIDKFFKGLCSMSTTTVGKLAYDLYKGQKWAELCSLKVNPRDYRVHSVQTFAIDYQIVSLFSKYRGFSGDVVDPKIKALEKWVESERRCSVTNQYFRSRWDGKNTMSSHAEQAYMLAQQKIRRILGTFNPAEFIELCRFGPGVDLGIRQSARTSSYHKYATPGHATVGAAWVLENYFKDDERLLYSHSSKLCVESHLFFVPKTWDEYRTATKSPRWNSFLQLGLGRCIEARLKSVGIDIKTQADVNRKLASSCHIDGNVTIDLKAASDSSCVNFVIDMLTDYLRDDDEGPNLWLDLILKLREPYVRLPDKSLVRQEKVSSMGNGYTFPLETLIFYSLAWGVCQHLGLSVKDVTVFGDDIIVPRDAAQLLIELLASCGYQPNLEKTFLRGEFFESCGHDYFRGRNVRPVFLKEGVTDVSRAYRLHNAIIAWGTRLSVFSNAGGCLNHSRTLGRYITSGIPKTHRLYGLRCELDGHLHAPWDVVRPKARKSGWDAYFFRSWVTIANQEYGGSYRGHLFSKLAGITGTGNAVVLRDTGRLVNKEVSVPVGFQDIIWTDG